MRRFVFFLLVSFLSFNGYSQTLQYLNFMEKPVIDTATYGYEYMEITTEENGVVHKQLISRDTVKVRHTTILLNDNGDKKSERVLGYFPSGEMEFSKRIDYEKDESREKHFYPDGGLKNEIAKVGDEVTSEIYYSEAGVETSKPVIEGPAPKGGVKGWNSYLAKTMRYPSEARAAKVEGTVLLVFDVDGKGIIENIKVGNAEFVHEALWKEAVRVVESYPHQWTPKMVNGMPVRSEVTLPLRFMLSESITTYFY